MEKKLIVYVLAALDDDDDDDDEGVRRGYWPKANIHYLPVRMKVKINKNRSIARTTIGAKYLNSERFEYE